MSKLFNRTLYYQNNNTSTNSNCSCDKYCDTTELDFFQKIIDFDTTYFDSTNINKIKEGKQKVKDLKTFFTDNILNSITKDKCCKNYCNTNELDFFKLIIQHYNNYYNLDEVNEIVEGSENLSTLRDFLIDKFEVYSRPIRSENFIKLKLNLD